MDRQQTQPQLGRDRTGHTETADDTFDRLRFRDCEEGAPTFDPRAVFPLPHRQNEVVFSECGLHCRRIATGALERQCVSVFDSIALNDELTQIIGAGRGLRGTALPAPGQSVMSHLGQRAARGGVVDEERGLHSPTDRDQFLP
jgi:hypothetical protein